MGTRLFSHKKRPLHLGPHPMERLARQPPTSTPASLGATVPPAPTDPSAAGPNPVRSGFEHYQARCDKGRTGDPAAAVAPILNGPDGVAANLVAGAYFLDADLAGTCLIPDDAWSDGAPEKGRHRRGVRGVRVGSGPCCTAGGPGRDQRQDSSQSMVETGLRTRVDLHRVGVGTQRTTGPTKPPREIQEPWSQMVARQGRHHPRLKTSEERTSTTTHGSVTRWNRSRGSTSPRR